MTVSALLSFCPRLRGGRSTSGSTLTHDAHDPPAIDPLESAHLARDNSRASSSSDSVDAPRLHRPNDSSSGLSKKLRKRFSREGKGSIFPFARSTGLNAGPIASGDVGSSLVSERGYDSDAQFISTPKQPKHIPDHPSTGLGENGAPHHQGKSEPLGVLVEEHSRTESENSAIFPRNGDRTKSFLSWGHGRLQCSPKLDRVDLDRLPSSVVDPLQSPGPSDNGAAIAENDLPMPNVRHSRLQTDIPSASLPLGPNSGRLYSSVPCRGHPHLVSPVPRGYRVSTDSSRGTPDIVIPRTRGRLSAQLVGPASSPHLQDMNIPHMLATTSISSPLRSKAQSLDDGMMDNNEGPRRLSPPSGTRQERGQLEVRVIRMDTPSSFSTATNYSDGGASASQGKFTEHFELNPSTISLRSDCQSEVGSSCSVSVGWLSEGRRMGYGYALVPSPNDEPSQGGSIEPMTGEADSSHQGAVGNLSSVSVGRDNSGESVRTSSKTASSSLGVPGFARRWSPRNRPGIPCYKPTSIHSTSGDAPSLWERISHWRGNQDTREAVEADLIPPWAHFCGVGPASPASQNQQRTASATTKDTEGAPSKRQVRLRRAKSLWAKRRGVTERTSSLDAKAPIRKSSKETYPVVRRRALRGIRFKVRARKGRRSTDESDNVPIIPARTSGDTGVSQVSHEMTTLGPGQGEWQERLSDETVVSEWDAYQDCVETQ
ncbi:uncharacterized protein BDW47DRAFT_134338 [Aspergillus candidus]|uniref:Uncharacterized protein n=1 Tax=Aspergillus candidus TaxID=41067 RepID=A0A2I2F1G2_ASPCN|nr:hypothetical protein BDW47DRAFT_134338 [Aspergillus candidus]PLB34438.1 hypothetical protein BDW47DRAFT_134338 [Aspergillus candidus]